MQRRTQIIPVKMPNHAIVHVEVTPLGGEQDIAAQLLSFDGVTEAIEEISRAIGGTFEKLKPRKGTVEFGLEVGAESGKLTALLVKGTGTASLKITLEWGQASQQRAG